MKTVKILTSRNIFMIGVFVVLMVFAVLVRLPAFGNIGNFAGDEGIQLLVSEHAVRYGDFRLDGEISSLENNGGYILHNSPIGYYLYTLFYVLGGRTPEGYSVVYFILNIIQALVLFGAGVLFFGIPGGLVVLSLALFSHRAVGYAVWPSQPINAIFFESVAIYMFAMFIRTKQSMWFWLSSVTTLFATQLYPPMYLFLLPKALLFAYCLRHILVKPKDVALAVIGAIAIYVPFIVQEYITNWNDVHTLVKFVSGPGVVVRPLELFSRIAVNVDKAISNIGNILLLIFIIVVVVIGSASRYRRSFIGPLKKSLIISVFILIPVVLVAFFPSRVYSVPERAYLEIVFPYICLLFGGLALGFSKYIVYVCVSVFVVLQIVKPMYVVPNTQFYIADAKVLTTGIVKDIRERNINPKTVLLFAIGAKDSWSWDSAIYWYELERGLGDRLVRIDTNSSKPKRLNTAPVQRVYLICHMIPAYLIETSCLNVFMETRAPNMFDERFVVEGVKNYGLNSFYILRNTGEILL